jgi:hypothetical protein
MPSIFCFCGWICSFRMCFVGAPSLDDTQFEFKPQSGYAGTTHSAATLTPKAGYVLPLVLKHWMALE